MREMIVVPFDDDWALRYEFEKKILLSVFGGAVAEIHHFGSTSIKGMSAKPTIDIMAIADDIDVIDSFNAKMIESGFTPKGEHGIENRRYFVRYAEDGENHLTHVHVYEKENPHVYDELAFRDYISANHWALETYEKIKSDAALKYRFSPNDYTNAKTDFVNCIMEKIYRERSQ